MTTEKQIVDAIEAFVEDCFNEKTVSKKAIISGIKYILEAGRLKSIENGGWISVDDDLPKLPPEYYDDENECMVKQLTGRAIAYDGDAVFEASYDKDGFRNGYITHWQSLPSPPQSLKPPNF